MSTTPNGHAALRYTNSVSAGSGWIDMLRRTNAQIRTGLVGAPRTAIRSYREANTLTVLQNLMPNLNPELLQRIVDNTTERRPLLS